MELDPMELTRDRSRGNDAMSCFNKSMDMGRHSITRTSAKNSIQNSTHPSNDNSNLFGESFATMGESFMGESFANMGDASFALLGAGGDDDYSYSDSNDDPDLETSPRGAARQELETVIDLEEEEEEASEKGTSNK